MILKAYLSFSFLLINLGLAAQNCRIESIINPFNLMVVNSQISRESYVRNEINVIYNSNGTIVLSTIVRSSSFEENVDTVINLNCNQISILLEFVKNLRMKDELVNSEQIESIAKTRNKVEMSIKKNGGVVILNGERLQPIQEETISYEGGSTFSLYLAILDGK